MTLSKAILEKLAKEDYKKSSLFTYVYVIVPFILTPLLCIYLDNWWLLFGILIHFLGVFMAATGIIYIVSIVYVAIWIWKGFNIIDLHTILYFSFLFGTWSFLMAMKYKDKGKSWIRMLTKVEEEERTNKNSSLF